MCKLMFTLLFSYLTPLLDVLTQSGANSAAAPAATATADAAVQNAAANPWGDATNILFIVIFGGIIVYMMFIQPRRAQKKKDEAINAIKVGDTILTSSGFFGRVAEIGSDTFIIEFGDNKGIRVPVRKEAVDSVREPSAKKD